MRSSLIIIGFFLLGNLICFIMIWSTHLSNEVNPKFISSSYDPKARIDFDSMILKSVNKLISKYFKEPSVISKYVGDLPLSNKTLHNNHFSFNDTTNVLNPDLQAKYLLMLNNDKTELRILQMAKNIPSQNQYDYKYNEISLFSIPIDNFIISYKNEFNLSQSIIKHCWSSQFPGKILREVTSNDKQILLFAYRVIKGNIVTYRLRYINNLSCDSENKEAFRAKDEIIIKEFNEYLQVNINDQDAIFQKKENSIDFQFTNNYIDDDDDGNVNTYDDFAINGNTPITALAVKANTISYARDMDYYAFSVIKKNNKQNESAWNEVFHTININKTAFNYYHTNSLKFISNDNIKLVQVYLTINSSSIYLICEMIQANYTSNSYLSTQLLRNKIEDIIPQTSEFNLVLSLKKLKKYLKPTIYSNNNKENSMMEFFEGTVLNIDWNETGREMRYSVISSKDKIERISGDEANENIIIMKAEKGKLIYINLKKNSTEYDYHNEKAINFKSLPKKFREQIPLGFLIEKFNSRVIMLMLMENGVILSLDFTKIVEKETTEFWSKFINEYKYTVILIIVANFLFFGVFLKIFRGRTTLAHNQRRVQDINQLIIDLNNINNELQNVQNAVQGPNIINEQHQPIGQHQPIDQHQLNDNDNNNNNQGDNVLPQQQPVEVINQMIIEQHPMVQNANSEINDTNHTQPNQDPQNNTEEVDDANDNDEGPLIQDLQ